MPDETAVIEDERRFRAVRSRDRRFDGTFFTAVRTTGIYCRPSCPAITPKPVNVTFYASAAAAQQAGYRACRRCAPDATPGSPQWDIRADVAGRAMRLVNDGLVEREGVPGLAQRLGYTPRHLGRLLTMELGAAPLALARARRAQTARILIETTGMPFADVAFAAGFASVRQFNATVAEVFGRTPSQLRGEREAMGGSSRGNRPARMSASAGANGRGGRPHGPRDSVPAAASGVLRLRLAVREPMDWPSMLGFLAVHSVAGVEAVDGDAYIRTVALPHGPAVIRLEPEPAAAATRGPAVLASLQLADLRDLSPAVERCRRLLDLDADPDAVAEHLGADPLLGSLVGHHPGLRVPGHVDGPELAIRAVVSQQVSVAGAHGTLRRMVADHGAVLQWPVAPSAPVDGDPGDVAHPSGDGGMPTRLFPTMARLAEVDPQTLPMTRARARTVVGLAQALAAGRVVLDRSADRGEVRRELLALPGIGPWTADVILMRALGDPDVFLPTDLGVRAALSRLGADPSLAVTLSDRWRPWRSYALAHLWRSLT